MKKAPTASENAETCKKRILSAIEEIEQLTSRAPRQFDFLIKPYLRFIALYGYEGKLENEKEGQLFFLENGELIDANE